MVIHSNIKIKDYQTAVLCNEHGFHGGEASRGMFRCPDPACRCDIFYRHGTYKRYIVSIIDDETEHASKKLDLLTLSESLLTQQMTILRICCTGCGQTHAILPCDIVPFHAVSLMLQLMILITICKNNNDPQSRKSILHQTSELSWPFLHALLLAYQSYRSRMCHVLRVKGLYAKETDLSDQALLDYYLSHELPARYLFLHVFSTQLFLTRRNTVSYPIRIIVL